MDVCAVCRVTGYYHTRNLKLYQIEMSKQQTEALMLQMCEAVLRHRASKITPPVCYWLLHEPNFSRFSPSFQSYYIFISTRTWYCKIKEQSSYCWNFIFLSKHMVYYSKVLLVGPHEIKLGCVWPAGNDITNTLVCVGSYSWFWSGSYCSMNTRHHFIHIEHSHST